MEYHFPVITHNVFVRAGGGGASPFTEEYADMKDFNPSKAHLSLQEVYGDFPNHNDGVHLTGGVPDSAVWQ